MAEYYKKKKQENNKQKTKTKQKQKQKQKQNNNNNNNTFRGESGGLCFNKSNLIMKNGISDCGSWLCVMLLLWYKSLISDTGPKRGTEYRRPALYSPTPSGRNNERSLM